MSIKPQNIFITGVNGFIGKSLLKYILNSNLNLKVRGSVRRLAKTEYEVQLPDLTADINWNDVLKGIDVVVHTAGRAHILNDNATEPLEEFRKINVEATLGLAKQAISSGVSRFVFISSIGVHGGHSKASPFSEEDELTPIYDYAKSKLEAEKQLKDLFAETESELVIVRPALVFAANAPGNFRELLSITNKKLPLPFKSITNRRSLVSLENLTDFLFECCCNDKAADEEFVIADDEVLTTGEIIDCLSQGMNHKNLCFRFPTRLVELLFSIIGKKAIFEKVFGNLEVNNQKAKTLLNWQPKFSSYDLLKKAGTDYRTLMEN